MTQPVGRADKPVANCKVCGKTSTFFDEAKVLRKHLVLYFRCAACGFIQTESPYWLAEAYSSAIARQDVGILERNLANRELTSAVLNLLYPQARCAVDFGGGHGILVRMMRDKGFDFRWYDPHATNHYARGFEHPEGDPCDLLTAFEVLEHVTDPVADLGKMMSLCENLLVSTVLVPHPAPRVADWWYYMPSTGQHISFYTLDSLHLLARRFGRHLLSRGAYHLFTARPKSKLLFRLATSFKAARIVNKAYRRPSLIERDFQKMTD